MNSTLSGIFIGAGIVIVLLLLLAAALFVGLRLGRARNASEVTGRIPTQDFPAVPTAPAQRNGHRLVVVQMYGTGDMYAQAIGLLDWGFSQYG